MVTPAQKAVLDTPALWRSYYNQQMGIPATGRSIYQSWLANQYGPAAAGYSLGQVGQGAGSGWTPETVDAEGNVVPAKWQGGQTFADWLEANKTTPTEWGWGATPFYNYRELGGQQQREFMDRMPVGAGFNPEQELLRSRFGRAGMPSWFANQMTTQAQAQRGQWAVDPERGLVTGPEAPSFLNYLFNRYGMGGGTQMNPAGGRGWVPLGRGGTQPG
jgi:hypothetical protein